MARRASLAGDRRLVMLGGMAFPAGGVIDSDIGFERGMRRVARETRQVAARRLEAVAGCQHHGLMARVPGVLEIRRIALNAGHAVALPAKIVQLIGGKFPGISRAHLRGFLDVIRGGPMTGLAADPQLVRRDDLVR
jgi:hypothetical protein